jgi:pimeloyl-ACP methyl ester carboxylesterase
VSHERHGTRAFDKPVLLAWGDNDKLFPLDHARRLEKDFPDARLEVFEGSNTYVMLDKPAELAEAIAGFVR